MTTNQSQAPRRIALAVCIVLSVAGCSSMRVHSDHKPQANFSGYKSFARAGDRQHVRSRNDGDRYISRLNLQRIARAIERELATKGYRQIENPDLADFLVSFTAGARDKVDIHSILELPEPRLGVSNRRVARPKIEM